MHKDPISNTDVTEGADHPVDTRLLGVALKIMIPLAQLSVAMGVRLSQLEEMLKRALINAGTMELRRAGIKINKSRLSISTGVHRKDVKRLVDQEVDGLSRVAGTPSAASLLYTHWSTAPELRIDGVPVQLPYRAGNGTNSFEAMARKFTTDAHPRTLLDEMLRLGLVSLDEQTDVITLNQSGFVPDKDSDEIYDLLAANVGDHLSAAVANVLDIGGPRLEQSLFERGLSRQSAEILDQRSRELWHGVMAELAPLVESLAEQDRQLGRSQDYRVRIGMYAHREKIEDPDQNSTLRTAGRGERGENNE